MRRKLEVTAATAAFLTLLVAQRPSAAAMPFHLESPRFVNAGEMPSMFTCEGNETSPPLAWSNVPAGTQAFALIAHDPDAPDPKAPTRDVVHWVLYNLPPTSRGISEGASRVALPAGASEGLNEAKKIGYKGPCPPIGRHRYFFMLYALNAPLDGLKNPTRADVERAMIGHVIEKTELVGTYEKKPKN